MFGTARSRCARTRVGVLGPAEITRMARTGNLPLGPAQGITIPTAQPCLLYTPDMKKAREIFRFFDIFLSAVTPFFVRCAKTPPGCALLRPEQRLSSGRRFKTRGAGICRRPVQTYLRGRWSGGGKLRLRAAKRPVPAPVCCAAMRRYSPSPGTALRALPSGEAPARERGDMAAPAPTAYRERPSQKTGEPPADGNVLELRIELRHIPPRRAQHGNNTMRSRPSSLPCRGS